MSTFKTTAIYENRLEDKEKLENSLGLPEEGNETTRFTLFDDTLFAIGYVRIVYGDHGPYIEFDKKHIKAELKSIFGNEIDYDNLPSLDFKYYYYWLYPISNKKVKVYLQIKPVTNLPNAPKRIDGGKHRFNRKEGYADYKRGYFYIDPYDLYSELEKYE
jgi:hypothetical protein